MKRNLLIFALMCLCSVAMAQENRFSINGGYVFANLEDVDTEANGWRITGLFEFNPSGGSFSHGFAVGYTGTTADFTEGTTNSNYSINSWPIYYAPKFSIGKGNLKGFVKGALGTHITGFKRTGSLTELTSTDMGFYGGVGAGASLNLGEKLFISAEYEWAYMSNSYYRDGFINSAMGGIGFRF
jgi:opacity protein-like surface antigen